VDITPDLGPNCLLGRQLTSSLRTPGLHPLLACITHEPAAATADMAFFSGVLGYSFDRLRTSSPCDVLKSTRQVRAPVVARGHDHLHDLATASRAQCRLQGPPHPYHSGERTDGVPCPRWFGAGSLSETNLFTH